MLFYSMWDFTNVIVEGASKTLYRICDDSNDCVETTVMSNTAVVVVITKYGSA